MSQAILADFSSQMDVCGESQGSCVPRRAEHLGILQDPAAGLPAAAAGQLCVWLEPSAWK